MFVSQVSGLATSSLSWTRFLEPPSGRTRTVGRRFHGPGAEAKDEKKTRQAVLGFFLMVFKPSEVPIESELLQRFPAIFRGSSSTTCGGPNSRIPVQEHLGVQRGILFSKRSSSSPPEVSCTCHCYVPGSFRSKNGSTKNGFAVQGPGKNRMYFPTQGMNPHRDNKNLF